MILQIQDNDFAIPKNRRVGQNELQRVVDVVDPPWFRHFL